jgi:tubulysin polyketide synthase-like protein
MKIHSFIIDLTLRGVDLAIEEGKLKVEAPAGVLTETDRAQLREHKVQIVRLIGELTASDPFQEQINAAIADGRKFVTSETIRRAEDRWKERRSVVEEEAA